MARPAEFNRDDVIEKAMNVFWRTGYASTSISDLVSATSLKPGSLYGAFKSKRDLFIEVVDTYAERSIQRVTSFLQTTPSPVQNQAKTTFLSAQNSFKSITQSTTLTTNK